MNPISFIIFKQGRRKWDCLTVGCVALDIIARMDELPGADRKEFARQLVIDGGGPSATASAAIACLGGKVAFFGAIGDDILGRYVQETFLRDNVESHLKTIPQQSSLISMVWVDGVGRRTIVSSSTTLNTLKSQEIPPGDAC